MSEVTQDSIRRKASTLRAALAAKEATIAELRAEVERLRELIAAEDAVQRASRYYQGARYPEDIKDAHRAYNKALERRAIARAALGSDRNE